MVYQFSLGRVINLYIQMDEREIIVRLNQLGMEYHEKKDVRTATFYYNGALNVLSNIQYEPKESELLEEYSLDNLPTCLNSTIALTERPLTTNWIVIDAMIIMLNVALLQFENGNIKKADLLLHEALKLVNDCHDMRDVIFKSPISTVVVMALYNILGRIFSQDEENGLPKAVACFTKALHIGKEILGRQHPLIAVVYVTMGEILVREEYFAEAMGFFNQASRIYNRAHGFMAEDFISPFDYCAPAA